MPENRWASLGKSLPLRGTLKSTPADSQLLRVQIWNPDPYGNRPAPSFQWYSGQSVVLKLAFSAIGHNPIAAVTPKNCVWWFSGMGNPTTSVPPDSHPDFYTSDFSNLVWSCWCFQLRSLILQVPIILCREQGTSFYWYKSTLPLPRAWKPTTSTCGKDICLFWKDAWFLSLLSSKDKAFCIWGQQWIRLKGLIWLEDTALTSRVILNKSLNSSESHSLSVTKWGCSDPRKKYLETSIANLWLWKSLSQCKTVLRPC